MSTVVLVGVTAWYAVLTRGLSRSARDSAASAERAAQAAVESVSIALASVDVEFAVAPSYVFEGDIPTLGVSVTCDGATVFVHDARLDQAGISTERTEASEVFDSVAEMPISLVRDDDRELPVRLHRDERLEFVTDPPTQLPDADAGVALLSVTVWYSLDGASPSIPRRVDWRGEVDIDYIDPGPGDELAAD